MALESVVLKKVWKRELALLERRLEAPAEAILPASVTAAEMSCFWESVQSVYVARGLRDPAVVGRARYRGRMMLRTCILEWKLVICVYD